MTKEKGLKVWFQQVGRGEAWNCFCCPRSLAEHPPGAVCGVSWLMAAPELSRAPCTRGSAEDRAEHGLCFALPMQQGRGGEGSAAGPPVGQTGSHKAGQELQLLQLALCAGRGRAQTQTHATEAAPLKAELPPPDSSRVALGWAYPVTLSPSWLTWTRTYHEKVRVLSELLCRALTCVLQSWVVFFGLNELCLDIYCTFSFPYLPKEGTQIF